MLLSTIGFYKRLLIGDYRQSEIVCTFLAKASGVPLEAPDLRALGLGTCRLTSYKGDSLALNCSDMF